MLIVSRLFYTRLLISVIEGAGEEPVGPPADLMKFGVQARAIWRMQTFALDVIGALAIANVTE